MRSKKEIEKRIEQLHKYNDLIAEGSEFELRWVLEGESQYSLKELEDLAQKWEQIHDSYDSGGEDFFFSDYLTDFFEYLKTGNHETGKNRRFTDDNIDKE